MVEFIPKTSLSHSNQSSMGTIAWLKEVLSYEYGSPGDWNSLKAGILSWFLSKIVLV